MALREKSASTESISRRDMLRVAIGLIGCRKVSGAQITGVDRSIVIVPTRSASWRSIVKIIEKGRGSTYWN